MKQESLNAMDKLVGLGSQDVLDRQQQARGEVMHQLKGELSFLSFLSELDRQTMRLSYSGGMHPLQQVDEHLKSEDSSKQEQKTKNKNEPPPVTQENPLVKDADRITRLPEKDIQDDMEMLMLDFKQLTAADMKVLQQMFSMPSWPWQVQSNQMPAFLEQLPQTHYKSLNVSKGLHDMLEKAYKAQRPVRIDLTETASIILRLGRDGRVSAEFMPKDEIALLFFQQNLQELRKSLESKQLPYGDLIVRHWKEQQQEKNKDKEQ